MRLFDYVVILGDHLVNILILHHIEFVRQAHLCIGLLNPADKCIGLLCDIFAANAADICQLCRALVGRCTRSTVMARPWTTPYRPPKVTIKASGDGLTYEWYSKTPGASGFTKSTDFAGTSYSVTMSQPKNGTRVYCRITDRYGNTVKTKTVTLKMKTVAKITDQPYSVIVGEKAEITVGAIGDGLTYQWYYKDVGAKKFSLLSSVKSDTYSVSITKARNGRQVYCKITDQYGNTVKTDTVTMMTMAYFDKLSLNEKKALAQKVAQQIADFIGTEGSELERATLAAQIVYAYCSRCYYTMSGKDYREAHGVFIKGEYSCAGSTRALGMVLDCMGIQWSHVNPNQYTHQWCKIKADGKIGWADGFVGMAGYGEYLA